MPYGLPIRRVVLLTPATSYRTADFLRAAERLRTEVIIGTDQTLVAAAFAPGRFLELNFRDREASVREIVALASAKPLAAIVGVDESTTLVAAAAARALGLTHNSVEAISICHHKYAFRVALKEAGLPSPKFQFVTISGSQSGCTAHGLSLHSQALEPVRQSRGDSRRIAGRLRRCRQTHCAHPRQCRGAPRSAR